MKTTYAQLYAAQKTLARLGSVTSDDGAANNRISKLNRQAKKAIRDFDAEVNKIRVKYGEEVDMEDGTKGTRVKKEHLAKFNKIVETMLDASVKFSGEGFTVEKMHELFKPSPDEQEVLAGWLLIEEKDEDYEAPDFAALIEGIEDEPAALRPSLVAVNGAANAAEFN